VKFHNIIVKFYNLEQTIGKLCLSFQKIHVSNYKNRTSETNGQHPLCETNGQHFFEKLVCCPLVSVRPSHPLYSRDHHHFQDSLWLEVPTWNRIRVVRDNLSSHNDVFRELL
jgi:hypothetical protein